MSKFASAALMPVLLAGWVYTGSSLLYMIYATIATIGFIALTCACGAIWFTAKTAPAAWTMSMVKTNEAMKLNPEYYVFQLLSTGTQTWFLFQYDKFIIGAFALAFLLFGIVYRLLAGFVAAQA